MKGILRILLLMAVVTGMVGCATYRLESGATQAELAGSTAPEAIPIYVGTLSFSKGWELRTHAEAELSPFLKKAVLESNVNARFVNSKNDAKIIIDLIELGFHPWHRTTTLAVKINGHDMTAESAHERAYITLGSRAWQYKIPVQSVCALVAVGIKDFIEHGKLPIIVTGEYLDPKGGTPEDEGRVFGGNTNIQKTY
jgi:hypothetical protein